MSLAVGYVRGRRERGIRKFQEKPKEEGVSLEFDIIDDREYVVHRYSTTLRGTRGLQVVWIWCLASTALYRSLFLP